MKKGIFGVWFKELATLIFTQTVQAFLLAIIMAIIVQALQSSSGVGSTYGAGLLAIIALSQFNKIEMLIKNIFGVTSQFNVGMDSGRAGLLGSLMLGKMALSGAKKVGDNAGKMIGGTAGAIKSKKHTRALQAERLKLEAEGNAEDLTNQADALTGEIGAMSDEYIHNASIGAARAQGAQAVGGTGSGVGISSSQIQELIGAVKEQTNEIKKGKLDGGKGDAKDKLKALDEQINESKEKTRQNRMKALSGLAETVVDLPAGALGVATGLAEGNAYKAATYGLTAAGAADSVVSGAISGGYNAGKNVVQGAKEYNADRRAAKGFDKQDFKGLEKAIREQNKSKQVNTRGDYDKAVSQANAAKASININTEIKKNIQETIRQDTIKSMSREQRGNTFNKAKKINDIKNNTKFDAGNN